MKIAECAGLGGGRIIFLHSSWCGISFCTCGRSNVGNMVIFLLLMSKHLDNVKVFCAPHPTLGGFGLHKVSGGHTTGQLTPVTQWTSQTIWCHP